MGKMPRCSLSLAASLIAPLRESEWSRFAALSLLILLAACGSYDGVLTQDRYDLAVGASGAAVIDETNYDVQVHTASGDSFGFLITCTNFRGGDPDVQYDPA